MRKVLAERLNKLDLCSLAAFAALVGVAQNNRLSLQSMMDNIVKLNLKMHRPVLALMFFFGFVHKISAVGAVQQGLVPQVECICFMRLKWLLTQFFPRFVLVSLGEWGLARARLLIS